MTQEPHHPHYPMQAAERQHFHPDLRLEHAFLDEPIDEQPVEDPIDFDSPFTQSTEHRSDHYVVPRGERERE